MKKIISLFLVVTALFSLFAINAYALPVPPDEDYVVEVENDFELMFRKTFRKLFNGVLDRFNLEQYSKVTDVKIKNKIISTDENSVINISCDIFPAKASNKNLIWKSSNHQIAHVDEKGTVTALLKGTATIYAIAEDGGFYDTVTITVKESDKPYFILGASITTMGPSTSQDITSVDIPASLGTTIDIYVSDIGAIKNIKTTVKDAEIADVYVDESTRTVCFFGKKLGTTTIMFELFGTVKTVDITVTDA